MKVGWLRIPAGLLGTLLLVVSLSDLSHAGNFVKTTETDLTFSYSGKDPSVVTGIDFDVFRYPQPKIDKPFDMSLVKVDLSLGWSAGMSGAFSDLDTGTVDLKWPARVTLKLDERNSYAPGDTVSIESEYAVVPDGGFFSGTPPRGKFSLNGGVSLDFSASAKGCLGACVPLPDFFEDLSGSWQFPLLNLTDQEFSVPFINRVDEVPNLVDCCVKYPLLEGYLDVPCGYGDISDTTIFRPDLLAKYGFNETLKGKPYEIKLTKTRKTDAQLYEEDTRYRFVDLFVDLDSMTGKKLGVETPTVAGFYGSGDLLAVDLNLMLTYKQNLKFTPKLELEVNIPEGAEYRIGEGSWQAQKGNAIRYEVGKTLQVKLPQNLSIPMSSATVYHLGNVFTTSRSVEPAADLLFSAAKFIIHVPGHDPVKMAAFDNVKVAGISLPSIALFDYTGTLGGISPVSGESIVFDPEDPKMQLDAEVSRVINHGGGRRTVVYTMSIGNSGDVPLKEMEIHDSLADAFAKARTFSVPDGGVRSCNLETNPAFGFLSGWKLLGPIVLDDGRDPNPGPPPEASGTGGTLQVEVDVRPGLYPEPFVNTFSASGKSWYRETPVAREARAAVDLGPARLESLKDFAIYANKKVLMKEPALVKGSIGSNDAVEIQNGSDTLIAGDIRALGNVDVHGAVTVDYIFTNLLLNVGGSGQVNGVRYFDQPSLKEVKEYVTPPMQGFQLPAPSTDSVEGPSVTFAGNSVNDPPHELAPGQYAEVEVPAGAKVVLKAGEFSIGNLHIEEGATILFDVSAGPISLDVVHRLKVDKKVIMALKEGKGDTRDVNIGIASHGEINIGENSQLVGTWVAPAASITFGPRTRLLGAAYAEMIKMEKGSQVKYHEEPWLGNLYRLYNESCPGSGVAASAELIPPPGEVLQTGRTQNRTHVSDRGKEAKKDESDGVKVVQGGENGTRPPTRLRSL